MWPQLTGLRFLISAVRITKPTWHRVCSVHIYPLPLSWFPCLCLNDTCLTKDFSPPIVYFFMMINLLKIVFNEIMFRFNPFSKLPLWGFFLVYFIYLFIYFPEEWLLYRYMIQWFTSFKGYTPFIVIRHRLYSLCCMVDLCGLFFLPHPQHLEVPGSGIKPAPQQQPEPMQW